MAEYSTSQMYKSSRDRTAHWVQSHVPFEGGFYSPSYPPSNADGFVPSSPSETDSTPPRMVLRYNDGRPDALIPREYSSKPRSRMLQSPPGRGRSGRDDQVPEEIRILPSFENGTQNSNSRHGHVRSKSMPRTADHGRGREPHMSHSSRTSSSHHKVKFAPPAQPSQPWHRQKQQQAVYPPHPGVFHHPPQFGPNGVIYSHSAPPATGYYPPQIAAPMRPRARYNPAGASVESLGTDQTYYIHMNRRKVHVIAPSPAPSIITAISTTKSASSPHSGKKPFFQRLFNFNKSAGSSHGSSSSRSRRHSMGASARHR